MTLQISLFGYFEDKTDLNGETGLTGSVDIWRNTKATGVKTLLVASGSFSEMGDGIYYYDLAGADPTLYDYLGVFKVAVATVSSKWVTGIRWDAAEGWATQFGYMDAAITSRSDFDPATDTVVNVTNVANVTGNVAGNVAGNLNGNVVGNVQGSVLGSVTVSDKTGYSLSATGIDAIIDEVIEGTTTLRQMFRLMASALFGKSTGGGTANPTFRDLGDTKNRITSTCDANGNRTSVTRDAT